MKTTVVELHENALNNQEGGHLVCCKAADDTLTLCGLKISGEGVRQLPSSHKPQCIMCDNLSSTCFCPVFGSCLSNAKTEHGH